MKRILISCYAFAFVAVVVAEAPRVFPEGQLPNHIRLKPLKNLNGHFPFKVPATLGQWEKRNKETVRQLFIIGAKATEDDFDRKARYIKYAFWGVSILLFVGFLVVF